jgi:hypothetical protein
LGEVLKRHKSGQKPLDAVLLDTSTNDFVVSQWGQNKERRQYLLAAIESMVRRLELCGMQVLTTTPPPPPHRYDGSSMQASRRCWWTL